MLIVLFKPQVDLSYRKAQNCEEQSAVPSQTKDLRELVHVTMAGRVYKHCSTYRGFELPLCRGAPQRAKSVSGAGNTDFTYRTVSQYLKHTLSKNSQRILPRLEPVCSSDLKCQQQHESKRRPEDYRAAFNVISQE